MTQLTLGEIIAFVKELKENGMTDKEIKSLPIYIGDDDELNGIHCGWDISIVDTDDDDEGIEYLIEMINERGGNISLEKGKAILIS